MDTAIYSPSLGREKLIRSGEVTELHCMNRTEFFCPECGETVMFIKGQKQSEHFRHNRKQKTKLPCNLRVSFENDISVNNIKGFPIYLKKINGSFRLYIGFRPLRKATLNSAKSQGAFIEINMTSDSSNIRHYPINRENFSDSEMILKELTEVNFNMSELYVKYSNHSVNRIIKNEWSNYLLGFTRYGVFFHKNTNKGKRIKKGSSIFTYEDYYYFSTQNSIADILKKYEKKQYIETLNINRQEYKVYKMRFEVQTKNESEFKKIASYLRTNHRLNLLENEVQLTPLWPPSSKTIEGNTYYSKTDHIFFKINNKSQLDFKVYEFKGKEYIPKITKITNGEMELLKIKFSRGPITLNINRKYSDTGMVLENKQRLSNGIYEHIAVDVTKVNPTTTIANFSDRKINVETNLKIKIRASEEIGILNTKENSNYEINVNSNSNYIYYMTNHFPLLIHKKIAFAESDLLLNDRLLNSLLKHSVNTQEVILTKSLRKILKRELINLRISKSEVQRIIEKNKIPISIARKIREWIK